MSHWPHLSKAPIVEGLIDIRVQRSSVVSLQLLKQSCDELAEAFPSRRERRLWLGEITVSDASAPSVSASSEPDGMILRSADEKWVAQFRLDGFTLSRLHPYGTWDELKAKAKNLWARYRAVAQPSGIVRVAARFINRIPLSGVPFEKTFATTVALAPALPQAVAAFLLRMVLPFDDEEAAAIVTQALEETAAECLFDLDAFSVRKEGFTEEEAWNKLDVLRDIKNRLFFESLTPEALERFK